MKAQSAIISTILLSSIILSIVTATFIWGQPLVQKTTDKIKIDTLTEMLKTIKNGIDNAQQTGSPSQVQLDISGATVIIKPDDNAIAVKTKTTIPIITSYTFVPLSYTELPFENELIDINTSHINSTPVFTPEDYVAGTDIRFGNVTLENEIYNVTTFYTGASYDVACFYQGQYATQDECVDEGQDFVKNDTTYTLSWISSDGTEVILIGPEVENLGVLGTDPGGIIIGKSLPISGVQNVELRLAYRGLIDASGRVTKTVLQCTRGCRTGEGRKKLKISLDRVERTENATYFYVNLQFE